MSIANRNRDLLTNDQIRFAKVRLIDHEGTMVGIVPVAQAQQMADENNLDLVLINPQADNPVCKIMDYGKYMFELTKKEREAKKHQKVISVKEVGFRLTTEEHDLGYKIKNACRFLKDGDRVKVVIKFRGREMAYRTQGYEVMNNFAAACADYGQVDRAARIEGRNMVMFLAPLKHH